MRVEFTDALIYNFVVSGKPWGYFRESCCNGGYGQHNWVWFNAC